jgi:hypothetical protein
VLYEVTASGSRNTGSVSYTDQDGETIRRNGIPLPCSGSGAELSTGIPPGTPMPATGGDPG